MDTSDEVTAAEAMRLRDALLHYVICLAIFIVMVVITVNVHFNLGFITFLVYIGLGIYLNRKVLRSIIEWHPIYNTLDNVASAKLATVIFWIVRYPILFFQLGINKVL